MKNSATPRPAPDATCAIECAPQYSREKPTIKAAGKKNQNAGEPSEPAAKMNAKVAWPDGIPESPGHESRPTHGRSSFIAFLSRGTETVASKSARNMALRLWQKRMAAISTPRAPP